MNHETGLSFTPEQEAVLGARERTMFVSAAAGSGKTAVLVERYVRSVLHAGMSPDRLPTVTFTRKAAAELKSRIRRRLREEGRPELAWALDDAPIGTIHSLCARVLRANAVAGGLDPGFAVLDETTAGILYSQAAEQAWREVLIASGADRAQALARHGDAVFKGVKKAYPVLRQTGVVAPRLTFGEPGDLEAAREDARHIVGICLEEGCRYDTGKVTVERNLASLRRFLEWLPTAKAVWTDVEGAAIFRPALNCGKAKSAFEPAVEAIRDFRDALGAIYLTVLAQVADDLIVRLHQRYEELKLGLGALDFQDLELLALKVLGSEGRSVEERPPVGEHEAAGVTASPFGPGSLLMIDEFQDTNDLQCRIMGSLAAASVLTVGDLYQSIYGFRGADCRVFADEKARTQQAASDFRSRQSGLAEVSTASQRSPSVGVAGYYELGRNFRSRPELIDFVNHVCVSPHLFGSGFLRLTCGRAAAGRPVAPAGGDREGSEESPAVTVTVVERGSKGDDDDVAEARATALIIDGLVRREGRSPGEIALLLRALTEVEAYEDALKALEVPCYVVQGRGYYRRQELSDVSALLRVLVTPFDEWALVTALRSPVAGISDDALYILRRLAGRDGRLWTAIEIALRGLTKAASSRASAPQWSACLDEADRERLARFRAGVVTLRSMVGFPGLSALVERALCAFDYDLTVLAAPDGRRRFANLRKLMRLADDFEEVSGPDLPGFLRYLDEREDLGGKEGSANVLAEGEDVVRLMTVHQAKGLEFPVVVFAGLGKTTKSDTPSIIVGRDGRAALSLAAPFGSDSSARVWLGPGEEIRSGMRTEEMEEEKRVVYVGMTRAMDRLVLVGRIGRTKAAAPLFWLLSALGVETVETLFGSGAEHLRPQPALDLEVHILGAGDGITPRSAEDRWAELESCGGVLEAPPPPPMPFRFAVDLWAAPAAVSFSMLHRLQRCRKAYYLRYVLGVPESGFVGGPAGERAPVLALGDDVGDLRPVEGDGGEGRTMGTVIHRALESLDLTSWPAESTLSAAVERACHNEAVVFSAAQSEHARRLTAAFWYSPQSTLPHLGEARKEVGFRFAESGIVVGGFFDLLLIDGSDWRVIDYKSNRLGPGGPAASAAAYRLQVEIYALAALASGAERVLVDLLFLESPTEPVSSSFDRSDEAHLRNRVEEAKRSLQDVHLHDNEEECGMCDYRPLCGLMSRGAGI